MDVLLPEKGAGVFPYIPNISLPQFRLFHFFWFHLGLTGDRKNYFHIVGMQESGWDPGQYGATQTPSASNNTSAVFVKKIEDKFSDADDRTKANIYTAAHEFTHQFDQDPASPNVHHLTAVRGIVPTADGDCIISTALHGDPDDMKIRWCIYHVYTVRDEKDAK